MDWALDRLGKLIHASERALFSYGFVCPTCGEPVRRRAGQERRAHFAHYSHSAKPECEYYHPVSATTMGRSLQTRISGHVAPTPTSLQGGLFLVCSESTDYTLFLKLPRLLSEAGLVGEIDIQSGLGVHTYTASQLHHRHMMRVLPQLPLVEVSASEQLHEVAAGLREIASRFKNSGNYFQISELGGRLLMTQEPLEWGERYCLLTQQPYVPTPVNFGVEITAVGERRGWYFYEVRLPTLAQSGDDVARAEFERFLGRTIRPPRSRVYFVDPPAHHVETDGAHVFPETTEKIIFRRTAGCQVHIEEHAKLLDGAQVHDIDGEWCEITGIGSGEFTVFADGREALLGSLQDCRLFQPKGVRMTVGDSTWEIFEPGLRAAVLPGSYDKLRIECPSGRVAEYLAIENKHWAADGRTFRLVDMRREPVFDGGNFGVLNGTKDDTQAIGPPVMDPQILARRIWIEGIVARFSGPIATFWIRKQWSNAASSRLLEISVDTLAWLQPYIRFARSG
jgi:Competence protein CoiA-like family